MATDRGVGIKSRAFSFPLSLSLPRPTLSLSFLPSSFPSFSGEGLCRGSQRNFFSLNVLLLPFNFQTWRSDLVFPHWVLPESESDSAPTSSHKRGAAETPAFSER